MVGVGVVSGRVARPGAVDLVEGCVLRGVEGDVRGAGLDEALELQVCHVGGAVVCDGGAVVGVVVVAGEGVAEFLGFEGSGVGGVGTGVAGQLGLAGFMAYGRASRGHHGDQACGGFPHHRLQIWCLQIVPE